MNALRHAVLRSVSNQLLKCQSDLDACRDDELADYEALPYWLHNSDSGTVLFDTTIKLDRACSLLSQAITSLLEAL